MWRIISVSNFKQHICHQALPWVFLLLYFLFVAVTAVFFIPPTWDEYLDFSGCVGAINHLLAFFRGQATDLVTITHDLEWYGNAYRWPAYLLWAAASGFPVRIPEGITTYDEFLASSFSSSIHLVSALYGVIGVFIFGAILQQLPVRRSLRIFSLVLFALSPIWLSNSFWNLKDLPVTIPLLAIVLLTIKSAKFAFRRRLYVGIVSFLLGTILANKYAYFPLVAILAVLFSFSLLFLNPDHQIAASVKPKALKLLALSILISFLSIAFSCLLTPQVFGNIDYPFQAVSYFSSHPLVSYDQKSSLQFLLSRASRLFSPSLAVLTILAILGLGAQVVSFFRNHPLSLTQFSSRREQVIIWLYAIVPTVSYLFPILVSGRTLYGPDLRHIIWLYPGLILLLTVLAENLISMLNISWSKPVSFALFIILGVNMLELFAIYPHYYSYLGIQPFPYELEQEVSSGHLVLSKYSPSLVPEVQSEMLRTYFIVSSRDRLAFDLTSPASSPPSVTGLTFPINPSYLVAYKRLASHIPSFSLYSLLGYEVVYARNGLCDEIIYKKLSPLFFSRAKVCY